MTDLTVVELCAGAGGQSLGLERAGFSHVAAIDNDVDACITLSRNRPEWDVIEGDIAEVKGAGFRGVDLLAAGVPCPPFSIAGKQLGADDERDLFPEAIRLVREIRPRAVMIENVRGLLADRFKEYRASVRQQLKRLGYEVHWELLHASNYGVPQLRPRSILVAMQPEFDHEFFWPKRVVDPPTVGEMLVDLMAARGWGGASRWAARASSIAPTIVGGSKKHGGPDLGPTRARERWRQLGVDGLGIADAAPAPDFPIDGIPRLTSRMVARIQGFPDDWLFSGTKTAAYRQIGNAFPPPVAEAVGSAIRRALEGEPVAAGQLRLAASA
ncbi:MAG: DNA cytosine methyltransferase [Chloroflexota bacterium]